MAGQTGVSIKVVSNRIPQMPAIIKAAVSAEVGKTGFQIEADAKAKVHVITATLQRSIHTTGPDGKRAWQPGDMIAKVGPSVDYGIYEEFGSRGRGPHPFMRPAGEKNAALFAAAVKAALGKL